MLKIPPVELTKSVHFPVMKALPSPPIFGPVAHIKCFLMYRRKFVVTKPYIVWCSFFQEFIYIPVGFVFDGASVPKALNSLYGPTGMLLFGAPPHDFGYQYGGLLTLDPNTFELTFCHCSKGDFDNMFMAMCTHESQLPVASFVAKQALTLAGFMSWNRSRAEDLNVVIDFPFLQGLYASVETLYDRRKGGRRSADGRNSN